MIRMYSVEYVNHVLHQRLNRLTDAINIATYSIVICTYWSFKKYRHYSLAGLFMQLVQCILNNYKENINF